MPSSNHILTKKKKKNELLNRFIYLVYCVYNRVVHIKKFIQVISTSWKAVFIDISVCVLFPLDVLVGCGMWLYRFLIIAFSSTFQTNRFKHVNRKRMVSVFISHGKVNCIWNEFITQQKARSPMNLIVYTKERKKNMYLKKTCLTRKLGIIRYREVK